MELEKKVEGENPRYKETFEDKISFYMFNLAFGAPTAWRRIAETTKRGQGYLTQAVLGTIALDAIFYSCLINSTKEPLYLLGLTSHAISGAYEFVRYQNKKKKD